MSVPPPPNQWGSQPPTGGQPAGGPQRGDRRSSGDHRRGRMPRRGGKGKWIFAAIAILAVIAVTVVYHGVGCRSGLGRWRVAAPQANGNGSDFASANDKGPVGIITEDPTCDAWGRVAGEYSAQTKAVNWGGRDQSVPASAWSSEQRTMYETVGRAMTNAGNQAVNLAMLTTHRVMRELYEQFIAYSECVHRANSKLQCKRRQFKARVRN